MTGKADRRRPLVVAIVLIAAIGTALVAPVMIGARRGEPIPGSTVRADSREAVAITTPLVLFASPSVVIERGTVALVGPAADESRVGALLRALVQGGGADLVLDRAKVVIDRAGSLALSPAAAAGTGIPAELGPVVASLAGFKFRSLTVLDSKVVIESGGGASASVSLRNVEITPDRAGSVSVRGQIEFRGERLDIDAAFPQPRDKPADAPVQVRAAVKGEHIAAAFNGRLATGEHGQITAENAELSISDLRAFANWLGASWPAGSGLGSFTAKGLLTLEEQAISFEHAEFTLDGNAATGALMVKLGTERPLIEGTLAFGSFDIAPYAAPSRPYALALASDWISGLRIPGLASPSFLSDLDADIRISAGNVMSGSDRLGRCAASLSVKGGRLYGEIAELELEQGGRGEGQFTIDTTGAEPRYTLRADLDDLDLATVVAPRLGPAALDGSGDIKLDLHATGASEADIAKSLEGKLSLHMSDGGRLGLDLDALPAAASAPTPVEGWGAVGAGTTTVSRLTASFTAASGVLTTGGVEATVDSRTVTATGTVDIDKGALDLVLSIAPMAGAAPVDPAAKTLGSFKVHGPWSTPTITRAGPGKAADATALGADPG
ncbi:AsmA-like C-terminal region-containing protein [Hyphomicrobium sp.]|uniref:AsmA family protein n=1 Tax=Hyphomicrobium sp. TaxID=82 RepID=UPI0025BB508D|nr:AsmA-like C-terminal region-containing protein [Hyphomicrobium sp.]MCC7251879.1 AsmA family protein [Hyphomicrobium sp.]